MKTEQIDKLRGALAACEAILVSAPPTGETIESTAKLAAAAAKARKAVLDLAASMLLKGE